MKKETEDYNNIIEAKYVGNLCVWIQFNDGTVRTVDVGTFIRKHPHSQYTKYLDEKKFKQFKLSHGNIVWGRNWDLVFDPVKLHEGKIE